MSQVLEDKIKRIQDKLELLLKKNAALQKENQAFRQAATIAKEHASLAEKKAEALQHQLDTKKYSQAMMDPQEKKVFEKKINGYIREIDKCIALLSV